MVTYMFSASCTYGLSLRIAAAVGHPKCSVLYCTVRTRDIHGLGPKGTTGSINICPPTIADVLLHVACSTCIYIYVFGRFAPPQYTILQYTTLYYSHRDGLWIVNYKSYHETIWWDYSNPHATNLLREPLPQSPPVHAATPISGARGGGGGGGY